MVFVWLIGWIRPIGLIGLIKIGRIGPLAHAIPSDHVSITSGMLRNIRFQGADGADFDLYGGGAILYPDETTTRGVEVKAEGTIVHPEGGRAWRGGVGPL